MYSSFAVSTVLLRTCSPHDLSSMAATCHSAAIATSCGESRRLPIERFAARGLREPNDVALGIRSKFLLQLRKTAGAPITDRRAQVLEHVAQQRAHRPARRDTDLHPFGAQRLDV